MALSGRNGMTVLKLVMVLQQGLDTVGMALQMSLFQRKKIVLVTYAQVNMFTQVFEMIFNDGMLKN